LARESRNRLSYHPSSPTRELFFGIPPLFDVVVSNLWILCDLWSDGGETTRVTSMINEREARRWRQRYLNRERALALFFLFSGCAATAFGSLIIMGATDNPPSDCGRHRFCRWPMGSWGDRQPDYRTQRRRATAAKQKVLAPAHSPQAVGSQAWCMLLTGGMERTHCRRDDLRTATGIDASSVRLALVLALTL